MEEERDPCLICLETTSTGDALRLPCTHVYHINCLNDWSEQLDGDDVTCPTCRAPISKEIMQELQRPLSISDMILLPIMFVFVGVQWCIEKAKNIVSVLSDLSRYMRYLELCTVFLKEKIEHLSMELFRKLQGYYRSIVPYLNIGVHYLLTKLEWLFLWSRDFLYALCSHVLDYFSVQIILMMNFISRKLVYISEKFLHVFRLVESYLKNQFIRFFEMCHGLYQIATEFLYPKIVIIFEQANTVLRSMEDKLLQYWVLLSESVFDLANKFYVFTKNVFFEIESYLKNQLIQFIGKCCDFYQIAIEFLYPKIVIIFEKANTGFSCSFPLRSYSVFSQKSPKRVL
eukprot:TRINITY_DN5663_c0_g1_i1.p1 TRINITY_DN5663_c0_g1~~TRINITY_DN5663_c0_g1_i1.p1  ORF type:complete len:343 (+),score=29.51 TRINITY_DN5663_c0_g1_i1:24-1052(+)